MFLSRRLVSANTHQIVKNTTSSLFHQLSGVRNAHQQQQQWKVGGDNLIKWETKSLKNGKSIGIISFNRPEQLNALNTDLALQFADLVGNHAANSESLAAVVLTGEGDKAFSAGGDLEFLLDRCNDKPHSNTQHMIAFYNYFLTPLLHKLQVPTVAAINGYAIGAGLCIAMACDVRVTCPEAKMGVTFTQLGLHPGMGSTHLLPMLLNHQIASYLLLTGDVVDGNRAKELGMVLETVQKESVKSRAIEIAEKMAMNPQMGVKTCLKSLRLQQIANLDAHLCREADAQAQCYATEEMKQIITKMKEKSNK